MLNTEFMENHGGAQRRETRAGFSWRGLGRVPSISLKISVPLRGEPFRRHGRRRTFRTDTKATRKNYRFISVISVRSYNSIPDEMCRP